MPKEGLIHVLLLSPYGLAIAPMLEEDPQYISVLASRRVPSTMTIRTDVRQYTRLDPHSYEEVLPHGVA